MRRPQYHFTPVQGWMNDPHGVVFDGERYHMFFQYVPGSLEWDAHLDWGHATSTDLVHWQEQDTALQALADEVGCWSGSVVMADAPHLFYTRPSEGEWSRGLVVRATGDASLSNWTREGVVVDGPPSTAFVDFRDPQVRRDDDGWRMTVGAGQVGYGGCALQYSSDDLHTWHFDGVLASRPWDPEEALPTGMVWECPQFLQVDGEWVLLVSAMDDNQATMAEVLYAIGSYDGAQFQPRAWGRFGHGRTVYATTTFRDHEGSPCAMSWLRDLPRESEQSWSGAQSLVHVLHVVGDRLVVEQHPALEAIVTAEDPAWRVSVEVEVAEQGAFALDIDEADRGWSLVLDFAASALHVSIDDQVTYLADLRCDATVGQLDVVVDAGIAEVTWSAGEGVYVFPVPDLDPDRIDITRWD